MGSESRIWCSSEPREIAGAEKKMHGFATLTFAPIDRTLIQVAMLSPEERDWLNAYHSKVLEIVGPQLDGEAKAWLEAGCAPL
jgi:Xaa-Pro aminopeptidase